MLHGNALLRDNGQQAQGRVGEGKVNGRQHGHHLGPRHQPSHSQKFETIALALLNVKECPILKHADTGGDILSPVRAFCDGLHQGWHREGFAVALLDMRELRVGREHLRAQNRAFQRRESAGPV